MLNNQFVLIDGSNGTPAFIFIVPLAPGTFYYSGDLNVLKKNK